MYMSNNMHWPLQAQTLHQAALQPSFLTSLIPEIQSKWHAESIAMSHTAMSSKIAQAAYQACQGMVLQGQTQC